MAGGTSGSHQSVIYSGKPNLNIYFLIDISINSIDEFSHVLIVEYHCYSYGRLDELNCKGRSGNRRITQAGAETAASTKT